MLQNETDEMTKISMTVSIFCYDENDRVPVLNGGRCARKPHTQIMIIIIL